VDNTNGRNMKHGIYSDLPMRAYLDELAFSSGLAQTLLSKSPLHAWTESPWNPARERDDSSTADIGTFAHAVLLDGGTDSLVICPFDDWRKKDAQQMRDVAREQGKLPILERKVDEVNLMVQRANTFIANSELVGLFSTGEAESTVIFDAAGVRCKIRPDWLTADRKICLSYKTTPGSAQPDAWIRTQLPLYDIGITLYEYGIDAVCNPNPGCRVVTLVQEQKPPFSCSLIGLAPAWAALATAKLSQALAIWRECLEAGKWPAYPSRICWAEPKPWMLAEAEERQQEEGDTDGDGIPYNVADIFEKP
jgi:PDDEXK-like domain of unknown function (DUF3799)